MILEILFELLCGFGQWLLWVVLSCAVCAFVIAIFFKFFLLFTQFLGV